ncbi:MAG: hypothetical protein WC750_06035 [Patescibacteria group bacterium]|jgi:hypothetical protein
MINSLTLSLASSSSGAVAQNATTYTIGVPFSFCEGFAAAIVTVSAGSVTISQQCSKDNISWFDAVDGTDTALGVVCTAMSAGTKYIQFDPVLSNFIRFKIVELNVASTTVGMQFLFLEKKQG